MERRIVKKDGKKYLVNVSGYNDDVGPLAPAGTLWLQSITDNLWYSVNLTGTSASAARYVNPVSLDWQSVGGQDFGYQLVQNITNNQVYQVYLSGSGAAATVLVSNNSWSLNTDYKPYLYLTSISDNNFYIVNITGSVALIVDQNSKWNPVSASYSYYR